MLHGNLKPETMFFFWAYNDQIQILVRSYQKILPELNLAKKKK